MARVYVSAVMNATLEQAWGLLRDFGALGNYHPFFEKSYIEDGKPLATAHCGRLHVDLATFGHDGAAPLV
eukprot:gene53321-65125_t